MSTGAEAIARWRSALPEELWTPRIFLVWVKKPKPGSAGKFEKLPYYASGGIRHGINGSDADRAKLVDFGDALLAYQRGRYDGIGVAPLADIQFWPLDLDDCIGDTLSPLAQRVVASGTYTERSPSGRGVRALFAGKIGINAKNHKAGVETFTDKGFVTLTGERIGGDGLLPCPRRLLAEILAIVRAGSAKRDGGADSAAGVSPELPASNPALLRAARLPMQLWRRLAQPYPPGCDRSAIAFSIALQLRRAGLPREQVLEVMSVPEVLEPALERRAGDIESARAWLWKYVVTPAFEAAQ